jgi:hypothetical protein
MRSKRKRGERGERERSIREMSKGGGGRERGDRGRLKM